MFCLKYSQNESTNPLMLLKGTIFMLKTIITIIQLLFAVILTVVVLFQSGKASGLSAYTGGSDTFFGRNKARSLDAKLEKLTVVLGIVFLVLTLCLSVF